MTLAQLLAGLAVAMALEGLLYAAFPGAMQRAVTRIAALPADRLRWTGLGVAVAGVAVASWLAG